MQSYNFDCGCSFTMPAEGKIKLDIKKIPFTCKRTWDLISSGYTKGVFQLESQLGRQWTKRLRPENLEHLTSLVSILRPGCLRALDKDGISMTEHYCRRKNGEEPVEYFHPALKPILESTYGVMNFQEQNMKIAQAIAGFDLQEADELRKACSKKMPEEMEKVGHKFIAGCEKQQIVTAEEAKQIFAWIKESQRYQFNKSHAACYAINGYYCAYCKAHFPVQTYTSWLYHGKKRQVKKGENPKQEIRDLINEAKIMNVEVYPPDITNLRANFFTDGKIITFGLSDVKGVGQANVKKLQEVVVDRELQYGSPIKDWTWLEVLTRIGPIQQVSGRVGASILGSLISVGAFSKFGSNRTRMLAELKTWDNLSTGEAKFIAEHQKEFTDLLSALKSIAKLKKEGGACHNVERVRMVKSLVELLDNPPTRLEDSPNWIAGSEEVLLGIALTCSRIDSCDTSAINTTCRDFIDGNIKNQSCIILGVEIQSIKEIKTKKGKNPGSKMARLIISDGTCAIEAICWPEAYKEINHLLTEQNTIIAQGYQDRKQGGFILQKAYQADLLVDNSED